MGVTKEALAQGQGINRERQTINQSMPATGFALFDSGEVTLDEALIAQRAESLKLALADAAAGGSEVLQDGFEGQFLVKGNQLAQFIATGIEKSASNGGQFERLQNIGVIISEE